GGGGGGVIMAPAGATTDVTGGIAGMYWDEGGGSKYGSQAAGVNWCAEQGDEGVILVPPPPSLSCIITEIKPLICGGACGTGGPAGQAGADLQVQVFLPPCTTTEPLSVVWSSGFNATGGLPDLGTADDYNLCIGTHTVTVTDNADVTSTCEYIVIPPGGVTALVDHVVDPSCPGILDGEVHGSVTGGLAPFTWNWGGGASVDSSDKALAGAQAPGLTYTVTVMDANNCTSTAEAVLTDPEEIIINTSSINETVCGDNDGTASVAWISGGTYLDVVTPTDFDGVGGDITGKATTTFDITVSDLALALTDESTVAQVCIDVSTVPKDKIEKVSMTLISPCGGTLELKSANNPGGDTFTDVCFTIGAGTDITGANGDFTDGSYVPEGGALDEIGGPLTGCDPNGIWQLVMVNGEMNDGVLDDWSIRLIDFQPGAGPPDYVWSNADETDAAISGLTGSNSFVTYTVTATDDNSCTATATVDIWCPVAPTCSIVVDVEPSCPGVCDGQATVTIGNLASGTSFSVAWDNSSNDFQGGLGLGGTHQSTANLCDLFSPDYTVTVTDEGTPTLTGTCTVNLTEPLVLDIVYASHIEPLCNGDANGSITFTYSGGTPDYSITTATSGTIPNQNSGIYTESDLAAGLHGIVIKDVRGCTAETDFDLEEPTVVVVIADGVDPLCFGSSDGNLTAVGSGGTVAGGYTYEWSGTVGTERNNIGVVASGLYTVTVTDDKGCTDSDEFELFDPSLLVITIINPVDPTCNSAMDGTMETTVSGGTPIYTYLWSDLLTTDDSISGLDEGLTDVTVTDSQGCTAVDDETLTDPLIVAATELTTPATCGDANGTAWIDTSTVDQVSGGLAPYTYLWDAAGGSGTNSLATGLAVGNYIVTVFDANLCFLEVPVSISDPGAPQIVWNDNGMVSCNGESDAFGEIEIVSGNIDFAITWSGGTPVGGTTALGTGLYSATGLSIIDSPLEVTITDVDGCQATQILIITEPDAVTVVTSPTNPSCFGPDSFGELLAVATGGTGDPTGFTYNWNDVLWGASQSNVDVTGTVDYIITVTDDNMCTGAQTTQLVEPTEIDTEISGTDPLCFEASDGTTSLTNPTGGNSSSYTYLWTPSGVDQNLTGLTAGTYDVIISDANLCTITRTINLVDPAEVFANASVNTHANCEDICFEGEVKVVASGGAGLLPADYTYEWDNGSSVNDTIFGLNNNIYCATVTDANGCKANDCVEVLGYPAQTWEPILVHNPCFGDEAGSIDLSMVIRGNGPPYIFTWDPALPSPSLADSILTDLPAGTYSVTISDFLGEEFTDSYIITEPAAPLDAQCDFVDPQCFGATDGSASVVASDGTAGYSYIWSDSDSQTTATADSLGSGTYTVTVTDANGCVEMCTTTLTDPPALSVALDDGVPSECGEQNGTLTAYPVGGTVAGDYIYAWSPITNSVATPTNLTNENHEVVVTDDNGCTATAEEALANPLSPTVRFILMDSVSCYGLSDGEVEVEITGGTTPYSYEWITGGVSTVESQDDEGIFTITGLSANDISITVVDILKCDNGHDTIVAEPDTMITSAVDGFILCYGGETGQVYASSVGGNGSAYTYAWDDDNTSVTDTATGLGGNTYNVTATDIKGCTDISSAYIDPLTPIVASLDHDTVTCYEAENAVLYAYATGGAGSFSYEWFTGDTTYASDNSVSNISGDNLNDSAYWVIIRDGNECVIDTLFEYILRPDSIRAHIRLVGEPFGSTPFDVKLVDSSHFDYYNTIIWYLDGLVEEVGEDTITNTLVTQTTISFEYILEVSRNGYCTSTDTLIVLVEAGSFLSIPDVFTPNGDEFNEKFMVSYINICSLTGQIFNRWGEKLSAWEGVETGWDGRTFAGEEVPDGVYFYLIDAIGCEGKEYLGNKGHVTIIR
ncbi:MAG: gliding motility-associated C-terminal domain-containing protein, partial [Flavobacteriales bacterium]|nr:gliding motility-associated C-terminal domain-containing protein [Flavobacteriales bacterium]